MSTDIVVSEAIMGWIVAHGVGVIAIVLIAFLARMGVRALIPRTIRRLVPSSSFHSPADEKQREDTLIRIVGGTLQILILVIASLMLLSEIGVDVGPMLAAAGVAGLAIGFGGQYLIRDVVSGLFVIIENQYRVGDVVCLDDTCGSVEDISIRMATLRDLDGTVHHVPHGAVNRVSNLSKEFARINLNIGVSYDAELEKVIRVIDETGAALAKDPTWAPDIIQPPHFERVDDFADSAVIVKILGDVKPLRQWAVAGELRKRLKIAFDSNGIEIPFPQRVVHDARS